MRRLLGAGVRFEGVYCVIAAMGEGLGDFCVIDTMDEVLGEFVV